MNYQFNRPYDYEDFKNAVRKFRPSDLVPQIANMSASLKEPPYSDDVLNFFPPWGLAAAARESLLFGNEFRSSNVNRHELQGLMEKFQETVDLPPQDDTDFYLKFMTQFMYEQYPFQESMFEEVSRSHAWMVQGLHEVQTEVISEATLASMLDGVPIKDAIGATFLLQVGAWQNSGTYNPNWLNMKHFTEVLEIYPRKNIEKMAARITTTPQQFRENFIATAPETQRATRFNYNPLIATPFVDMGDGKPVAPATRLILSTVTPSGLYYPGVRKHGSAFARDLGRLFEHYIGRQLNLLKGARVTPEISYGRGNGSKSVDWFVVLPHLVILVEVKSARLGPGEKVGSPKLIETLNKTISRARNQLAETIKRISEQHAEFEDIPTDRRMLGLIVTAEPFYTANNYLFQRNQATIPGGNIPDVPITVLSANELEKLVLLGDELETRVLGEIMNRKSRVLNLRGLITKTKGRNPILKTAWDEYPWLNETRSRRETR